MKIALKRSCKFIFYTELHLKIIITMFWRSKKLLFGVFEIIFPDYILCPLLILDQIIWTKDFFLCIIRRGWGFHIRFSDAHWAKIWKNSEINTKCVNELCLKSTFKKIYSIYRTFRLWGKQIALLSDFCSLFDGSI